ncbi:helix-turn-helix domain-containing protein [Streptomyces niveus]|uniref:helix-turn-helix domain-containing protein n=1 Tax=Streptomyces niveus TaxID=193462 RepID=UPI0036B17E0E
MTPEDSHLPDPGISAAGADTGPGDWAEAGSVTTAEVQLPYVLMRAAARSAEDLVQQAADLIGGYVAITSPVSGTIYDSAGPEPAGDDERKTITHHVANTLVTLHGGAGVSARRITEVAKVLEAVLMVRVRRAHELQEPEMRLHTSAVRGLLTGETATTADIIGGVLPALATVYRLTGGEHAADVWRAVLPAVVRDRLHTLVAQVEDDLAVVSLHSPDTDDGKTLRLVAHVAEEYDLLGGVADPMPVALFAVAWVEADQARTNASATDRLVPVGGLGAQSLLHILPARRYAAWAHDLLRPLTDEQRATLEIWLGTGSTTKAARGLGLTRNAVHARLKTAARTLAVDLNLPEVRTALLLALRAPDPGTRTRGVRAEPSASSLLALIPPDAAKRWAGDVLAPLDDQLKIALRVWLEHHGKVQPAAAELATSRSVLDHQLAQAAAALEICLTYPVVRAELHVATTALAHTLPTTFTPRARHLNRRPVP